MSAHPFAAWLTQHTRDETPPGRFAREVGPTLPDTGDRAELRHHLYVSAPEWLPTFDLLWAMYSPVCSYSYSCTEAATALVMGQDAPVAVCPKHARAVEDVL